MSDKSIGEIIASAMRSRFIETNGIRLEVHETGDPNGKPVVLLHGFPEFWYGWRKQIDALANSGYRVIIPDQRGYNRSDKPQGRFAYRLDYLAADIIGILDQLGIERTCLIGHDWGGVVAWHLAMHHPERLIKLVNLNIPHPKVMVKNLKNNPDQRRRSWYIFFFQLPKMPEFVLGKNNFENMVKILERTSRKGTFTEQDFEKYREAWAQPGALTGMINWYRSSVRMMFVKRQSPRISVPTKLIWGMRDKALSDVMAQPSIDYCDYGELAFIENASHWVQHEEPAQVNRLILDFLND